jgi:hypothetical protein
MHAQPDTANHWFHEAAKAYVEHHQGCPWCGGSYCLSRHTAKGKERYSCQICDFQVCHDSAADRYDSVPGVDSEDSVMDRVLDF